MKRTRERGERDAGEQHRRDRGAAAARRDRIEGRGRRQGAEERGDGQERRRTSPRQARAATVRRARSSPRRQGPRRRRRRRGRGRRADCETGPASARRNCRARADHGADKQSRQPDVEDDEPIPRDISRATGDPPKRISNTRPGAMATAPCVSERIASEDQERSQRRAERTARGRSPSPSRASARRLSSRTLTAMQSPVGRAARRDRDRGPPSDRARRRACEARSRGDKGRPSR